jgi:restriction endonuclease S subunit
MAASGIPSTMDSLSVQKLTSTVKRVRDMLRKVGITDMDSMMHCVLFTAARMLDKQTLHKLSLPPVLAWEVLMGKVEARDIAAADAHFKQILRSLDQKFGMNKFPYSLKSQDDFVGILRAFNEVDIHDCAKHTDVLGYIYEQHLSTGSGSGRDLGKFYTDRLITKYLTELLGVDVSDSNRPASMCDATMGTGGFILSYIDKIVATCKDVKWDKYDIAGGDIDDKVAAIAKLNVFLKTGIVFEMIRQRNTLKDDIFDEKQPMEHKKFKRLLMNVPFGVKGLKLADDCCSRVKEIVKSGTKSEPLFLALTCQLLDEGGKAAVIVPDGILVNQSKQHDHIRNYILDNFELKRIIKMRGKFFMNTGIQPSVLYFENTGKPTRTVEFWDVEKTESGQLIENMILSVPRAKFDASSSFDLRRYQEDEKPVANPAGFPMVKLGDILVSVKGKELVTIENSVQGNIPLYSASVDVRTHNRATFDGTESIIQACVGSNLVNCIHYVNQPFATTANLWVLRNTNTEKVLLRFVYYWLKLSKSILTKVNISVLPKVNKSEFDQIQMPLPSLEIQKQIVATLDRIYTPGTTELADTLKVTDRAMDLLIANPGGATLEPIVEAQRLIRKSAQMIADVKAQMVAVVKATSSKSNTLSLKEICAVSFGERITQKENKGTLYPVYGGGETNFHTDRFNREGSTCKVARFAISEKTMVLMLNEKYWLMDSGFTVSSKDTSRVIHEYLWWILWAHQSKLASCSTGSCQKNISMDMFYTLEFGFPSLEVQTKTLSYINDLQAQLTSLESLQKQSERNVKFILDCYLNTA